MKEPFSFVVPVVSEDEKHQYGFVMPKPKNFCSQKCQDKSEASLKRAVERRRVEAEKRRAEARQRMAYHFGGDDTDDDYDERERRYYDRERRPYGRRRHRDD
jgi:hypothetical protein